MKDIMHEIAKQADKLAPVVALVGAREVLKKLGKGRTQKGGKLNVKGGFYKELLSEAKKLAVPALLMAGRELIKKSTKKKKGGARKLKK